MSLSFLEVYNEDIFDLLSVPGAGARDSKDMSVRDRLASGGASLRAPLKLTNACTRDSPGCGGGTSQLANRRSSRMGAFSAEGGVVGSWGNSTSRSMARSEVEEVQPACQWPGQVARRRATPAGRSPNQAVVRPASYPRTSRMLLRLAAAPALSAAASC